MKRTVSAMFVLLLVVAVGAACGKKNEGTAPSTGGTMAPSGDKIGVAECDTYIEKLTKCLDSKVPEAAKGPMKSSFDQAVKGWKDLAMTPAGKTGLATACKMALDQSKQTMAGFGCDM
jgi:hypothetical protein